MFLQVCQDKKLFSLGKRPHTYLFPSTQPLAVHEYGDESHSILADF